MFYIYEWYNKDNNEIFYVGKGIGNRYKVKNRNKSFNEYLKNHNCDVRIINYYEDELMCFQDEDKKIKELKNINQCQCNKTYGGCGGVKTYWTKEMKDKMSKENPMKSTEQRERMKNKNPMHNSQVAEIVGKKHRKPFMIGNKRFDYLVDGATFYNVTTTTISNWIKQGKTTKGEKCYHIEQEKPIIRKNKEQCYICYKDNQYKTIIELSEKTNIPYRTLITWIKQGFSSKGEPIRYSNDTREYIYKKPNRIHNNIPIEINGVRYNSKKEAIEHTKIPRLRLDRILNNDFRLEKTKQKYKYLNCKYVNQQPSCTNSDNSSAKGSTTNE